MADLYAASAGTLIKTHVASLAFVTVGGLDDLLKGGKMLATSLHIDRNQEVQFLKTLSNLYYIYAFGEAPGKIMLGGLVFFADCGNRNQQSKIIGNINSYYEQNNAYTKKDPTIIAVGGASFRCLLTSLSIHADMTPYNYASFSLAFSMIPKSPGGDIANAGAGAPAGGLTGGGGLTGSGGLTSSGKL